MPIAVDDKTNAFVLTLLDFSGGLNTRDLDSLIRDNELSDIRNFTYDKFGALTVRNGFSRINASAIDTNPIMTMGGYYKTGETEELIATSGTSIYKYVSSGQSYSSIKTGLTGDGLHFGMHQFMDHYYMGNGTDAIQVYDGTNVWNIGYTPPTSGVTATEGAAGVLENKKYQYKVTFYYSDGESNPNETATAITPTAEHKVELTNIPKGNSRVTQRKLYRTVGDGETFKLLTTISDNTTTTYSDNMPDSGLGADIDTDNNTPPKAKYIINHKARLWFAGDFDNPSRLYYAKALHNEAVPSNYYWDIGENDGDEITGLAVNLGALVIYKKYSTWVISGDIPTGTGADMVLEKVNPSIGCISDKTIKHAGNDLLFMSPNLGVHRLHRVILATSETMDAEALTNKIHPTVKGLNKSGLTNAFGEVYNHKYYLFVPNSTSVYPDISLVLDLRKMSPDDEETIAWTVYDNMDFSCSCQFLDSQGEHIFVGSSNTGLTHELESGTDDDGARIVAYATTKYFEMGSFLHPKVPRLLACAGRASEDYEFTTRQFLLWNGTEYQATSQFSGGGVAAGEDVLYGQNLNGKLLYGVDGGFTSTELDYMKTAFVLQPAHKIKLKIEDVSANQNFAFYGYEIRGYIGVPRPMG